MTYLVNEKCIKCKLMDCVEVCPVDAIVPDTEKDNEKWLEINTKYSEIWPNIKEKKDPPKDNEKYKNEENKFEKYFKENIQKEN